MTKVLVKASNEILSHCSCDLAFATNGQLDCPWCGCGWLFTCCHCRKAFTFAKVISVDSAPNDNAIYAGEDLEQFEVGEIAIYLDGMLLGPNDTDIDFTGYYAHHKMPLLPYAQATRKSDLDDVFGNRNYWVDRALPSAS